MYSYCNNVNNSDFSLQSECMHFAVPLHTVCSITAYLFAVILQLLCSATATALQRDCNGFAVTLQKVCSDFAAGHQATAYS